MDRRGAALALLVGPLTLGRVTLAAGQQPAKVYRVGYLSAPSRQSVERSHDAFLQALRDQGWIENQNLLIEYRWADGNAERLPDLARELVSHNVDLIVAPAGAAALAAKSATSRIPIVMIFPSNPVEMGLVASLRRPAGNVTGTTFTAGPEIFRKQLQILKEAVPQLVRVANLGNPSDPAWTQQLREVESAAQAMGIRVQVLGVHGPEDFDGAFAAMNRERAQALIVGAGTSMILVNRTRFTELALRARLPVMYNIREMVEGGGLMSYGVNMTAFVGRAAVYVDKILKGAKPADLPVEQPTKFELVINLKTASAIGIKIPQSLLVRADEVIQ